MHNLDGCEISLVGDDLDPEWESLLLDASSWQQRGLELTNTSAYLTIAGQRAARPPAVIPGNAPCSATLSMFSWRRALGLPLSLSPPLYPTPIPDPCLLFPLSPPHAQQS